MRIEAHRSAAPSLPNPTQWANGNLITSGIGFNPTRSTDSSAKSLNGELAAVFVLYIQCWTLLASGAWSDLGATHSCRAPICIGTACLRQRESSTEGIYLLIISGNNKNQKSEIRASDSVLPIQFRYDCFLSEKCRDRFL